MILCFNPRSHEGSDGNGCISSKTIKEVSIHAPMKGATQLKQVCEEKEFVSIHAPMKGATHRGNSSEPLLWCFNPRSHEGSDFKVWYPNGYNGVSIHAPMKGATLTMLQWVSARDCFNPRSHEGSDTNVFVSIFDNYSVSIHAPMKGATFL